MVRVNLSKIHFRPYSEGETPTTFGPNDYTVTPGAINLSAIKFRPWQDQTLGEFVSPGGGGGGGGGTIDPADPGSFMMNVSTTGAINDEYVYKSITATQSIYMRCLLYITSAQYAATVAGSGSGRGEILDIAANNDPINTWEGLFVSLRNQSNIDDNQLWLWDYWCPATDKKLILPDTFHVCELGARFVSGTTYEFAFGMDGNFSSWNAFDLSIYGWAYPGFDMITAGIQFGNTLNTQTWNLDNIEYATDNWLSAGGTQEFISGFETGDLSEWDGSVETPTVVATP